ncbi:unnamed protein product, partial [Ectocarpus sp. 12 AP-2014]
VGEGDVFYLWLLLKKGATPRSFKDARTVHGLHHDTFKEAASAAGRFDSPLLNEATFSFQEAVESNATPRQLRGLFILLVRSGFPVAIAFDKYFEQMIEERWKEEHTNIIAQRLQLLRRLQQHL